MADLSGSTIATTYDRLLALPSGGGGGTTLKAITDGDGTTTFCLQLATTSALIAGADSKLLFYDNDAEHISANASGVLSIAAGAEIDLTATAIDINGTVDVSSTLNVAGNVTFDGGTFIFNASEVDKDFRIAGNSETNLLFCDASADSIGIGCSDPGGSLEISKDGSNSVYISCFSSTEATTGGLYFRKADGTRGTANQDKVDDNAILGLITFAGMDNDDGSTFIEGARIQAKIDGTPANEDMPCDLEFYTNPGTATVDSTPAMTLSKIGSLTVTGTTNETMSIVASGTADGNGEGSVFSSSCTAGGSATVTEIGSKFNTAAETNTKATSYIRLTASDQVVSYLWIDDDDVFRASSNAAHIGTTSGGQEIHGDMTSDERLKTISSDPFPYGLSEVNKLVPIKYKFKTSSYNRDRLGFGAQTTQPIIPEIIRDSNQCIHGYDQVTDEKGITTSVPKGDESETKLVMQYDQVIPVLVKAVQELSAKVTALENA